MIFSIKCYMLLVFLFCNSFFRTLVCVLFGDNRFLPVVSSLGIQMFVRSTCWMVMFCTWERVLWLKFSDKYLLNV